jgi:hypothetical protein
VVPAEAAAILSMARQAGLRVLDTAAAYGTAEDVLGGLLGRDERFRIVTKTLPMRQAASRDAVIARARRSVELLTFPVSVTTNITTKVSGIFIAPTISTDKSEVRRGDNIVIFGQSSPLSEVTISINSDEAIFVKKNSDAHGTYLVNFDTSVLPLGAHHTRSKASQDGDITEYGNTVAFQVGTKNITRDIPVSDNGSACKGKTSSTKADVNCDVHVNLVDFSVLAYWYKRARPPVTIDLNNDGKVDLVDFSIMAFYWTG